jgi:hypothetical protein
MMINDCVIDHPNAPYFSITSSPSPTASSAPPKSSPVPPRTFSVFPYNFRGGAPATI